MNDSVRLAAIGGADRRRRPEGPGARGPRSRGAARAFVENAVAQAVKGGRLWLTAGTESLLGEEVPDGLLGDDAVPQAPPAPLPATDVLPSNLPEAWPEETTTALAIANALSAKVGKPLPWPVVKAAIDGAIRSRLVEPTSDSAQWPCDFGAAQLVRLHVPTVSWRPPPPPLPPPPPPEGVLVAEAELRVNELQELGEQLDELKKATAGVTTRFFVWIEVGDGKKQVSDEAAAKVNEVLARVAEDFKLE